MNPASLKAAIDALSELPLMSDPASLATLDVLTKTGRSIRIRTCSP